MGKFTSNLNRINNNKINTKIRQEQYESLVLLNKYLNDESEENYALIKLPTGVGKTGVISCLAYNNINAKMLLVCSSKDLLSQLKKEIEEDFWEKVGIDRKIIDIKAKIINTTKGLNIKSDDEIQVYICTINILEYMKRSCQNSFNALVSNLDYIVFDEGHKEPANVWRDIIEEINKKTIILTATPYRNDERKLNVTDKYTYYLSFTTAIEKKYIKDIEFKSIAKKYLEDIDLFCQHIFDEFCKGKNDKIIIRCNNSNSIKLIVYKLNNLCSKNGIQKIAVGLHSTFNTKSPNNEVDIYDSFNNDFCDKYNILIHEDILSEGFNLIEFNKIIFYNPYKNNRSIIQQVGRVLRKRNVNDDSNAEAYINEELLNYYVMSWENYIKYDISEETRVKDIKKRGRYDISIKNIEYLNGNFIGRLDFDAIDWVKYIYLNKTATIYKMIDDISLDELAEKVKRNIITKNIGRYNEYFKDNVWVLLYEKYSNSSILQNKFYFDKKLSCVVLIYDDLYLYYYDSSRAALPDGLINDYIEIINSQEIEKLLSKETNYKELELNNLNLSNKGIQKNKLKGNNLEESNFSMTNTFTACTQVIGYTSDLKRKLNIPFGRIKDYEKIDLKGYIKWCRELTAYYELESNEYLTRYAKKVREIGEAKSLIVDLTFAVEDDIEFLYDGNSIYDIESIYSSIESDKFTMNIYDQYIGGKVNIIKGKTKTSVNIQLESNLFTVRYNGERISLEKYLNSTNSFKILFDDGKVYFSGGLYQTNQLYKNTNLKAFPIENRIVTVKKLKDCNDEKFGEPGKKTLSDNWPEDCVFGTLINYIKGHYVEKYDGKIDYLVCDDMRKEIADFIGIDEERKKIILIHCKHGGSNKSASSFQDVCGQAIKNLGYVNRNSINLKEDYVQKNHIGLWNSKWDYSKKNTSFRIETNRIVIGNITGENFWDKYKKILMDYESIIEIWLFVDLMSKEELDKQLGSDAPEEQISQIMVLLNSTDEMVSRSGAILKIFCKP